MGQCHPKKINAFQPVTNSVPVKDIEIFLPLDTVLSHVNSVDLFI